MNKRLYLVPKPELTLQQERVVNDRLNYAEHKNDNGPIRVWNSYSQGLYAFFRISDHEFIGIAESSGLSAITAGWWIDSKFRGQGYGNDLVDVLAEQRKNDGATSVSNSPLDTYLGQYDAVSSRLMERFKRRLQSTTQ